MKAIILESASTDAGNYNGMKNVVYGQEVECEYCDKKQNSIYIPQSEMIRIGGDEKVFSDTRVRGYMWGDFKVVEK